MDLAVKSLNYSKHGDTWEAPPQALQQPSWNMPRMWRRKIQILGVNLGQTLQCFWGWLSQREPSVHGQSCHLGRLWAHWEGGSFPHSIALTTVTHSQHLLPPARPSLLSAFATGWQIPGMPGSPGLLPAQLPQDTLGEMIHPSYTLGNLVPQMQRDIVQSQCSQQSALSLPCPCPVTAHCPH